MTRQPVPATLHPTLTRRAKNMELARVGRCQEVGTGGGGLVAERGHLNHPAPHVYAQAPKVRLMSA